MKYLLKILLFLSVYNCYSQLPISIILKTEDSIVSISLDRALSMQYVREHGNNRGKEVEMFLKSVNRNPGDSWCAAFAYDCFLYANEKTGIEIPIKKSGLCRDIWNDALKRAVEISNNPMPKKKDVIVWKGDGLSGHIARVVAYLGNGFVSTIEGNTGGGSDDNGDGVYLKKRNYKCLMGKLRTLGFITWIYPEKFDIEKLLKLYWWHGK